MSIPFIGSNNTYDLLKEGINASNVRAKAIANNMANINTKNYKKFNVVFEENLKSAKDSKELQLRRTNDNHIEGSGFELKRTNAEHFSSGNSKNGNITIEQDKSTSMRTDGNNVDLDIEKVNQAANTLKYNALITKINGNYNNLKTVIK